jgi:hypothetical protein
MEVFAGECILSDVPENIGVDLDIKVQDASVHAQLEQ